MIKSNHIGIDDWQAVAQNLCGMGKVHKKPAASHWDSAADTAANDDDLVVLPPTLPLGYEFVRFKSPIPFLTQRCEQVAICPTQSLWDSLGVELCDPEITNLGAL